jgi:hypothetical protein
VYIPRLSFSSNTLSFSHSASSCHLPCSFVTFQSLPVINYHPDLTRYAALVPPPFPETLAIHSRVRYTTENIWPGVIRSDLSICVYNSSYLPSASYPFISHPASPGDPPYPQVIGFITHHEGPGSTTQKTSFYPASVFLSGGIQITLQIVIDLHLHPLLHLRSHSKKQPE